MSSLHHSFSTLHAETYGLEEAILIHHFQYWIEHNRELKRNFKEGRTWMYQTQKEIAAFFPYWSQDTVFRIIKKLEETGVIIKGNFNKTSFDRTMWYAFVNEEMFTKPRNRGIQNSEPKNGKSETAEPIPYSKTDSKTKQQQDPPQKTVPPPNNLTPSAAAFYESPKEERSQEKRPEGFLPIHECLTDVPIPVDDKEWLTKTYSVLVVEKALAWWRGDTSKVKTTLQQALKEACKRNYEIPVSKEQLSDENKSLALKISASKKVIENTNLCVEIFNHFVEIGYKKGSVQRTTINYTENGFKDRLINALQKHGVDINGQDDQF